MARPTTKQELIEAANIGFDKLWTFIDAMSAESLNAEFDFAKDDKKKEAHWQRDKNLRDVLVHLYEWHQLILKWIKSNTAGKPADFLPKPYTWKTYGDMNVEIWKKHQNTPQSKAEKMLRKSHKDVVTLVSEFSDDALFTKQHFDWTGTTTLGSYCVSTLSSHYDWALKKLKAHVKNLKN